jgi:two-component system, OmpR family, alkaline phosphatase synthesis response regulator PhoP
MEKSVLICDDDEGILDVTSMVLESYGYRVMPLLNSLKVIDTVRQDTPDLIILDLWMPGLTGEQLATELKTNPSTARIPIIIISASRDGRQIADRVGADAYIEKPFDIATLTGRVKQYTDVV